MFPLYSNSKGSGAAVWVRRLVQTFAGCICYKNHHSRAGSYLWPLAAARLWVMSLEKRDKRWHFVLFITSSTVCTGRWRKLSLPEPKLTKQNYCVPSDAWASSHSDQSSLSAWRNRKSLDTHWANEANILIRLAWFPGWTESSLGAVILLVLPYGVP